MVFRRGSAAIAAPAALACAVALLGGAPAAAATSSSVTTASPARASVAPAAARPAAAPRAAVLAARTVGRPPANAATRPGSVFSYPNQGSKAQQAIRKRMLGTIRSTWGGRRNKHGVAFRGNGTIRIATWTFQDWAIARALVAAHKRGVSVQVIAAKKPNRPHRPWKFLRSKLKSRLNLAGHPETRGKWSFARHCYGSCRGHGGTPHSKYLLATKVGSRHRTITMQTSANLTKMAYQGQWNHATTTWNRGVHSSFSKIFAQSRLDKPVRGGAYRAYQNGPIRSIFFPRPRTTATGDPIMRTLRHVNCKGATAGSTGGRTRIRVIQYAIYDKRGVWIAKRLRNLWNAGCDVKIIFAAVNRPVLNILKSRSGRGPVPMRQSVIRNASGDIVKYNHNKWLTITGRYGASRGAYVTLTGSANWGNAAFTCDEVTQQLNSVTHTRQYLAAFTRTWKQRSSRAPRAGAIRHGARTVPGAAEAPEELVFGRGEFKYMAED